MKAAVNTTKSVAVLVYVLLCGFAVCVAAIVAVMGYAVFVAGFTRMALWFWGTSVLVLALIALLGSILHALRTPSPDSYGRSA